MILEKRLQLLRLRRRGHDALRPVRGDGEAVAVRQGLGGAEDDAARLLLDDLGVLAARALRPGIERGLREAYVLGQRDARLGKIESEEAGS